MADVRARTMNLTTVHQAMHTAFNHRDWDRIGEQIFPACMYGDHARNETFHGPEECVALYRREIIDGALHELRHLVYGPCMASHRLNITLDEEQAAKLARLAGRVHVNEGTLARSLLSTAIDDADPDPDSVIAVLDGIDGAWERAELGRRQATSGQTIPLSDL